MPPAFDFNSKPPRRRWPLFIVLILLVAVGVGAFLMYRAKQPRSVVDTSPAPTAAEREPADTTPTPPESHFRPPKVLTTRPVTYPEQAFLNRVEGVVRVKFSVDENGKVTNAVVVKSSGSVLLDAMVLEYDLKQWTFQPATLDGKPIPGSVEKDFEFRLDEAEQRALAEKRLTAKIGTPDAPYPKAAVPLRAQGSCTINVTWTKAGLVDSIVLKKGSGSNILDRAALRWAYENWRIDPKEGTDKEFSKTMTFTPPPAATDTPPPLTAPATTSPAPTS